MNQIRSPTLSARQKKELKTSINDYLAWLRTKVEVGGAAKYKHFSFPKPSAADWIMWVRCPGDEEVLFNTHILRKCSLDYYKMVVLHECFHLFVQDLPNKEDAKRLKDDFGDEMMKLLDIEADYFTWLYYRERLQKNLIDILKLQYEGSKVFGD